MLGQQQDRGTGRKDSLSSSMLNDVLDVTGTQEQFVDVPWADVASSHSTAAPCGACSSGQARRDEVAPHDAREGPVGQCRRMTWATTPQDLELRGAWIVQVEHRAVAVHGDGGEPIEYLSQGAVDQPPQTLDQLVRSATEGGCQA